MKLTIGTILCGCALIALAITTASAQTNYTFSGTCKAFFQRSIPAGDPGHTLGLSRGKCTDKEAVGGATATGGQYAERDDITATHIKGSGVYTVTFSTGDKIYYQYDLSLVTNGNVVQSGTGMFTAAGGTGKMNGITAKGTCKFSAGPTAGTNSYSCTGQYEPAGAMSH
jgi:hypothetical protein